MSINGVFYGVQGFRVSGLWEVQAQKLQSPDNIVGINAPKWPNYEAVPILLAENAILEFEILQASGFEALSSLPSLIFLSGVSELWSHGRPRPQLAQGPSSLGPSGFSPWTPSKRGLDNYQYYIL